uniref:Uncharacterized protein n=1 Tax=Glossina morsitans morsitans TaxID=37546 RepID=A0A1B0GBZ9_GLOMM
MALDICFDIKTFLERTCRTCSRYFNDEMVFFGIFRVKLKDSCSLQEDDEVEYEVSDDVKEVFDDLNIWKLNIKPNDGLPSQICAECLERFRQVHLFREECLDSQKVLQSYFLDIEHLLESGKLSPKLEPLKPAICEISEFLDPAVTKITQKSPIHAITSDVFSPFSSPRLRLSPRFAEISAYADSSSSIGTPPPLFEEMKTEPIDMETMESIKPESELPRVDNMEEERDETLLKQEWDSSENESSTPTTDEDIDSDDSFSSDEESLADYPKHQNVKKTSPHLKCKVCGAACANRQLLKAHHMRHHPQEKPFACNICSSSFKSTFLLAQHKLKHNRPDTMQCQECGKYFRSQLHLQRHNKNFHLTSTYTCHICHQQFESYTQMRFQYHLRQHGEKRFPCTYCDKAFHQKIHLINHERTHTKEQPFSCDLCGKAYRQQTACQEHMKTHKDPTPFKCKLCPKSFSQRSTLRIHIQKTHNLTKASTTPLKRVRSEVFEEQHFLNF